jgi:hypothetical protein
MSVRRKMNETTLGILITSITGILTALITAVTTAYTQIKLERIKAEAGHRTTSDEQKSRLTSAGQSPNQPLTVTGAIRSVNWPITILLTVTAVAIMMIALLLLFQSSDKRIPIESLPIWVVPYGGVSDPGIGQGSSSLLLIMEEPSQISYFLDYSLPDTGDGHAGLVFRFHTPQDLTDYEAIEVTISFSDERARCEIFFKDIADQVQGVRLGDPIPPNRDVRVSIAGQKQTVHIPLKANFGLVNFNVVKEIGFHVHTGFSRGTHAITISEIVFLRP